MVHKKPAFCRRATISLLINNNSSSVVVLLCSSVVVVAAAVVDARGVGTSLPLAILNRIRTLAGSAVRSVTQDTKTHAFRTSTFGREKCAS